MENIKSFLNKINSKDTEDNSELENTLEESVIKDLSFNEVYLRCLASKQDTIKVKEIILESEIDFIKSAKQLKSVFDLQLKEAIEKVNDLYNKEQVNLQTHYRKKLAGEGFLDLIKAFSDTDFSLVIMNSRIYAYKFYKPYHDVYEGSFQSGVIYEYDEPVCTLKGVYVNLLHPRITGGTVLISTDNRHPNADSGGLSEVCVGNLEGRAIPLENTTALIELLHEICETYESMHLDSAYFIPEQNYATREGKLKWTA